MPAAKTVRAKVETCALFGAQAVPVTAEVEVGGGLPGMQIAGLGDTSVQEARLRVRSAIKAAGFKMPNLHIVVNLAPASLKKTGTGFDLPIAVALLVATGQIPSSAVGRSVIVGELSLEGSVRPVDGLIAHALYAKEQGMSLICAQPQMDLPALRDVECLCIDRLSDLRFESFSKPYKTPATFGMVQLDFKDVAGQEHAIRAMTIAAAGGHGLLMTGPPGSGKSMLARRLPSILPPLSESEQIEAALIHSVAGLDISSISAGIRPFRSPHHSASTAAIVGGGTPVRPGEVSLAHRGVLFLDELGEFQSCALQALRQPLEDGEVALSRAGGRFVFPARFQLIAASNPCPCGYLGDRDHACKCTDVQIDRYRGKLGGPVRDRIDLACEVGRVDPALVMKSGSGMSSAKLRDAVMAARERIERRGDSMAPLASLAPHEVIEACGLRPQQQRLLENCARKHGLSGRAMVRALRVARTIADLENSPDVADDHLFEALSYRVEGGVE